MEAPVFEIDSTYYFLIIKEALVGIINRVYCLSHYVSHSNCRWIYRFSNGICNGKCDGSANRCTESDHGPVFIYYQSFFLITVNGHHLILDGIYYSYQFIPMDQVWLPFGDENVIEYVIQTFSSMFMIALQMSLPVVASLFLVDVALGIAARTFPQLNIFVVGIPLKIGVSFIILIVVMSTMMFVVSGLFETMLYDDEGINGFTWGSVKIELSYIRFTIFCW